MVQLNGVWGQNAPNNELLLCFSFLYIYISLMVLVDRKKP